MKKSKRLFSVIIIAMLLLVLAPTTALAATGTQDGVSVVLTTDKTSCNAGDTVTVNVKATNTNTSAVSGVKVSVTLPDGLTLASGQRSIDIGTMAAGETKEYTLTATAAASSTATTTTSSTSPKTGDNNMLFLWIGIVAAAVVMGVLVYRKKRTATKLLSLLLCLVLALCAVMPATTAFAATTEKSFTVNETITVGGTSKTITAKVTYTHTTGDTIAVTGVTIAPTTAAITVGGTTQLTATVEPANATNKTVTWESSNTGVATVNNSGLVTAVSAGTATITATTADGNKTAPCTVTVVNATYTFNTPAAATENGVTATVTFDKTSPQAAGTTVTATVTLSGTATAAGFFSIDMTSTKAGLFSNPKNKTVAAGETPADTYTFSFTIPSQNVDDLTLAFSFVEPISFPGAATGGGNFVSGGSTTATLTANVANADATPASGQTVTWSIVSADNTANLAVITSYLDKATGLAWGDAATTTPGTELTATTTSTTDGSGNAVIDLTDILGERTVVVRASVTIDGQTYTADQTVTFGAGPMSKLMLPTGSRDAVPEGTWQAAVTACGGTAIVADLVTTAGYITTSNLPELSDLIAVFGGGNNSYLAAGWAQNAYWSGNASDIADGAARYANAAGGQGDMPNTINNNAIIAIRP